MEKSNEPGLLGHPYQRFFTREVRIGQVIMGGGQPVRIQSMVNTVPEDLEGTVRQIVQLSRAGSELVRLTVPSVKDAHNLELISTGLIKEGITTPLVADVHFNPQIAEICAGIVEKVRINPGNYRKPGRIVPAKWDDLSYRNELDETEELLVNLIEKCRIHGTALRIGSNHGSLSPRIIHRYGDTPTGMVEAALEFARICNRHGFDELVLSMKSSNVRVMVHAYRMLVDRMTREGFNYPLHLGVTEAGSGIEGRIKSAAGIGLLLDEGIGDTIRVSLTEDPVEEIPVARKLMERYRHFDVQPESSKRYSYPLNQLAYKRRESIMVAGIGGSALPVVVGEKNAPGETQPDFIPERVAGKEKSLLSSGVLKSSSHTLEVAEPGEMPLVLPGTGSPYALLLPDKPDAAWIQPLKPVENAVLILQVSQNEHTGTLREWIDLLDEQGIKLPLILRINTRTDDMEELAINCAVSASCLLTDGLADGLWISGEHEPGLLVTVAFRILQATRARITAPEYISCPSCGRTRFNIQEAVQRIKARTGHLTGLKIGIMGCIVNGPGEMADADYGYVGSGNRTITLYKGKEVVKRGVREEDALEALVELIKENGDWKEPG